MKEGGAHMSGIKFEIQENFGVISRSKSGWNKELNFISWNERESKYDIRDWSPEHDKMGKGITLTKEELKGLRDVLNNMDL